MLISLLHVLGTTFAKKVTVYRKILSLWNLKITYPKNNSFLGLQRIESSKIRRKKKLVLILTSESLREISRKADCQALP